MAQTRGVFAIIIGNDQKSVLLSERSDGRGWNLPGGKVESEESDEAALQREVLEETGLDVIVHFRIGPDHVFGEDTAVAYICEVIRGTLCPTSEAKQHRFVTKETACETKLVGPEGRLGRTGRMVWDGLSILEKSKNTSIEAGALLPAGTIYLGPDGTELCRDNGNVTEYWPRLDPFSPTGKMESQ